ncbi:MAG: WbqC family protein [Chitinophagaceae bacterium]|nr:WbqC family protein [Chitinophagaceae bacterium]
MILVSDLQYFPSIILYKISNKSSNITFDQYEFYQKMSFRNRCQIAGAQGRIDLSVPLVQGRDQKTVMKDVRIANTHRWQDRHWKTILACYSRSPWFEYYRDELEHLYRKPFVFLKDWDLACFEWTNRILALPLEVTLTDAWRPQYEGDSLDLRGKLVPRNIQDIDLAPPVVYRQVFEEITGFIPNLSILDLLFCEGQRARSLLAQIAPTT